MTELRKYGFGDAQGIDVKVRLPSEEVVFVSFDYFDKDRQKWHVEGYVGRRKITEPKEDG